MGHRLGVFCVCMLLLGSSRGDLLTNGGFEEGENGALPSGWSAHGGVPPALDRYRVGDARQGEGALLIIDTVGGERTSETRASSGIKQRVTAEPGQWYQASCWAKCLERSNPTDSWLQLHFIPSGKRVNTHLKAALPGGDWQRFTAAAQAPEDTTHVEWVVKTLHLGTCRYLIDDARLERLQHGGDDQRLALLATGHVGIDEVRPLNLHTPLVQDGRAAAAIAVADEAAWREAGLMLQGQLQDRSGVALPLVRPERDLLRTAGRLVVIGNIGNNAVVERMWLNRYQEVTLQHPGPGEYILQLIPEPYGAPRGSNVILIGASDPAGARRGVEALMARLGAGPDLALNEWVLEVSTTTPLAGEARETLLAKKRSKFWLKDFWTAAQQYQRSGDLAYAELARRILLEIAARYRAYAADPNLLKYWPAPTSANQFRVYWSEETTSEWIGAMWDFIEECPVFSPDDRWVCSNALLSTCHDLTRHVSWWGTLAADETVHPVAFNHTTFPLLGTYFLARYYARFYPDLDNRIDDYLARVDRCFRAQMQSWKPSEDANGYVSIVPRHVTTWSLAEGDYGFLESGRLARFLDFIAATCDSSGDPASYGDNGYGRGRYTRDFPMGVWYYRSPQYAWWLSHLDPAWQNPYRDDLEPVPWQEAVGVRAFEITPALYEFTRRHYRLEPTVPRERCFDKISFRENLDPNGEFLLLDGYARGLHMHYDANAIIKYYAGGEDWLIDGDYLVRNTTDHSMLSLTLDGRCDRPEPPFAELECLADRPGVALSLTRVPDVMGADWQRSIVWLKGRAVCVLDEITARQSGDFNAQCIWKMLDRGQLDADARGFRLTRSGGGSPGRHALERVLEPAPDAAAALRFSEANSRLDFSVELPAATYALNLVAKAADRSTDSLWAALNNSAPIACHLTLGQFGRSYDSGVNPKSGPMPMMTVDRDGQQVLTITVREKPGALLDRIEFIRPEDGAVIAAVEAEDAPLPPADLLQVPKDRVFVFRGDGRSRLEFSRRLNHSRLPLRYAHQKFSGQLDAGQSLGNVAIFSGTVEDKGNGPDVRRLADGVVQLWLDDRPFALFTTAPAVLGLSPEAVGDARMVYLSAERLLLAGVRRLGERGWPQAVTCDIDLNSGRGVVAMSVSPEAVTDTTFAPQVIDMPDAILEAVRQRALVLLRDGGVEAVAINAGEGNALPPLAQVARVPETRHREVPQAVTEMLAHDLDGDGADELLVLRGRFLTCIDASGTLRWEFDGQDELYAVCAYDTDGDGRCEVFTGGKSKRLYLLAADGSLLRDHEIETYWRVSRTTIHEPRLDDVLVRDFAGDGDWEAVLGTVDGFTQVIDHTFRQRWIDGETNHGTTEMQAVDWNEDGILDVAVGNRYGKLRIYQVTNGALLAHLGSELGDVQLAVADLNGDGTLQMINGSSTGALRCGRSNRDISWEFPNHGYTVRDILCLDMREDPRLETLIAADTEFLYMLDAAGNELAHLDLGSEPCNLAPVPGADKTFRGIAVGTRSGRVLLVDADLQPTHAASLDSQVNWVTVLATRGGSPRLGVGLDSGAVVLLRLPPD